MKHLILLALVVGFTGNAVAQVVNIPDPNFKGYLLGDTSINANGDTAIDVNEASAFTGMIMVFNRNISDLTGIEAFTALTELRCDFNKLTSLDLSSNTALTYVECSGNQLDTLTLPATPTLAVLNCGVNFLTSLDLSNVTGLTELRCMNIQSPTLDVSNNAALTLLHCSGMGLTSLNVSNNIALSSLDCNNNNLQSLDVSNNTELSVFMCYTNQLTSLNMANGNNNKLGNSDFNATSNPGLKCIEVDDVAWSTANWTNIDTGIVYSEDCSVGTGDISISSVNLTPNPVSDILTIQTGEAIQQVTIYNVSGEVVLRETHHNLTVNHLPQGIYLVKILTNSGISTGRFVKE